MKITKQSDSHQLQLRDYAKRSVERYQALSKREKKKFLDEFERDFGVHRKSIIRLMARLKSRKVARVHSAVVKPVEAILFRFKKRRGRKEVFHDANVVWWLQSLWISMNQVSEKLMHAMIPEWIKKIDEVAMSNATRQHLLLMSPSTIERLIRSYKKENRKKLFCTTKPPRGKELMIRIPTRVQNFEAPSCGYVEGDTVAHCGGSLMGSFGWTFNTVDHKSLWTEQVAFLSNTAEHVVEGTIDIRGRLPFRILSFHSDGGSEFINKYLYEYLRDPKDYVVQTHGRAYKKNDQARVEQRNWTHVRQIFGYERISDQKLVDMMNDIYRNEWRLLNNFFTATRKQTSKIRMGSKFKRSFDKPRTPYQRVLEDKGISEVEKEKLEATYAELNPFELKKSLDRKLKAFGLAIKEQNKPADMFDEEEVA